LSSDTINPDRLYSLAQVCALDGTSIAALYIRLGRGEYGVVWKDGKKTLISGAAILARRAARLKPAKFKIDRVVQGSRFHTIRKPPAESTAA
jgi:hypothetical protein